MARLALLRRRERVAVKTSGVCLIHDMHDGAVLLMRLRRVVTDVRAGNTCRKRSVVAHWVKVLIAAGSSMASVDGGGMAGSRQDVADTASGASNVGGLDNDFNLPVDRRRYVYRGGYPADTLKADVEAHLRSLFQDLPPGHVGDLWGDVGSSALLVR